MILSLQQLTSQEDPVGKTRLISPMKTEQSLTITAAFGTF
jgi:hypothetical protein